MRTSRTPPTQILRAPEGRLVATAGDRCLHPAPLTVTAPLAQVDPRALREQLSLSEEADVASVEFLRFVVRLSEAMNRDIPARDWAELVTLQGCLTYVSRLSGAAGGPSRGSVVRAPA